MAAVPSDTVPAVALSPKIDPAGAALAEDPVPKRRGAALPAELPLALPEELEPKRSGALLSVVVGGGADEASPKIEAAC